MREGEEEGETVKLEYESCRSCRHFMEIVGLGKPHPLRCIRKDSAWRLLHNAPRRVTAKLARKVREAVA